jgi:hypothetical protein
MRTRFRWALLFTVTAVLGTGCIVNDTLGDDLIVDWRVESSTSTTLCATYGVDRWVISASGPEARTTTAACGSTWSSGGAFTGGGALIAGNYTITVAAEDAVGQLLATKSIPLNLRATSGLSEQLSFVFLPSDFSAPAVCNNDGTCEPGQGETPTNCPNDCQAVGCNNDGTCEPGAGEDEINCPNDCAPVNPCNNDGVCEPGQGETELNCPNDCQICNNDGVCEPGQGETEINCPNDCDVCNNDGSCDTGAGEDELNCPADCPNPCNNDGFCEPSAGEDAQNCPNDC